MAFLFKLIPGVGIITAVIAFLTSALDFLKPVWVMVLDFFKWYLKTFWTGLGQLLNNLAIIAVVAPLLLFVGGYIKFSEEKQCKATITQIHEEYTLIKKKGKTTKELTNREVTTQEWNPFKQVWELVK